ncbi:hypothetical protein QJQ45_029556 [Haematococcus lacustris]|nr:hypothetical protein QJQ45_029556 [Haematococcus lacustris]
MATAKVAARWLRKGGRAVVAVSSPDGSAIPQPEVTPHGLRDAIKAQLDALLAEYSDVFTPLTGLPADRPVGHTIPLEPGNRPPATPMYRLSKPEHDELKQQLQDLLAKGSETPVTQTETAQYPAAPAAPMGLSDQLNLGYQQDPAFTANADHSGMYQDTDGLWRISGKAGEFLVQWEGYDASFNTWEPRANLTGCDKLLAEYNAIHCLK